MPILHQHFPEDMRTARPLPGLRPVEGDWLRVDEAYAGQMARREALLAERRADVLWSAPVALVPARELLDLVLGLLPGHGFVPEGATMRCPDGRQVAVDREDPLGTLGRLVQCDFCLLAKRDAEHVLKGAILCFPASWRLDEKADRPLTAIHEPVAPYDAQLARRVQRLFDGVRAGRPIWRFNRLRYDDPELHQPRSVTQPRQDPATRDGAFVRSERQTILRLPVSGWVVFAIHTYVLRAEDMPAASPAPDPARP